MSWTDERVEVLKKLWGEGQSASQIAKELGGVTRNAVIGKVHRLGLSNRATSSSSNPRCLASHRIYDFKLDNFLAFDLAPEFIFLNFACHALMSEIFSFSTVES